MSNKSVLMTTTGGNPIADNQNSVTAGARGPLLMQDFHLLEKLAHQNRERIPERTVHAKGSAAYGTLTVTKDITKYTKVKALSQIGKETEAFLRFSTVAGERGAADDERHVRGVARRAEIPGFHPHPEAPPANQHAVQHGDVGLLVALARELATRSPS